MDKHCEIALMYSSSVHFMKYHRSPFHIQFKGLPAHLIFYYRRVTETAFQIEFKVPIHGPSNPPANPT